MKIKLMIAAVIACFGVHGIYERERIRYGRSQRMEDIRRRGHTKWCLYVGRFHARALLNDGKGYTNFELDYGVRTTTGGKGILVSIQTLSDRKGYRIALNNDREDPVWWRMTGSLVSVRNLTKSFVKENEWFKMNIRVEGQLVRVRINGEDCRRIV